MNYTARLKKLIKILEDKSLCAFLIKKRQNISYLVGTKGEDAILFVSKKSALITDARYEEDYKKGLKNCSLLITQKPYEALSDICKAQKVKRIGFESNNFSYMDVETLKKKLGGTRIIPCKDIIENLRMIKCQDEIALIKKACRTGCRVMSYAFKNITPGIKEIALKNRVESYILKNGIRKADFDIIIASGATSSMPHVSSSNKLIKKGRPIIIDLGAKEGAYNSDLTRSMLLGRIDRKFLDLYKIVIDAQRKAIEKIRPGVKARDIDYISRQYISEKGLGKYFIHSLGHGIGLEVHEKPKISRDSDAVLMENMALTIEPGIYIPGWGGVRIEDVLVVTKGGSRILTKTPRFRSWK